MILEFAKRLSRRALNRRGRQNKQTPAIEPARTGWPASLPVVKRDRSTTEIMIELPDTYTAKCEVSVYPQSLAVEVFDEQGAMLRRILPLEAPLQGLQPTTSRQSACLVGALMRRVLQIVPQTGPEHRRPDGILPPDQAS